jgi:hypothetical protein
LAGAGWLASNYEFILLSATRPEPKAQCQ